MLLSIALVLLVGMFLGYICKLFKLPALLGMIITGIILGPYVLNLIDIKLLDISSELRKIALIIILLRAGLSLDLGDLKKVGLGALLMSFVPATFEIVAITVFAPLIFGVTYVEAALMGCVVAAVSPAVIVPKMIKIIDLKYGANKAIPQMILAAASVDDVYVIVLFSVFLGILQGGSVSALTFVNIPLSIILGMVIGFGVGYLLCLLFKKFHLRDTVKVIIIMSVAFIMVAIEDAGIFSFASLIGVMVMGISISRHRMVVGLRLKAKFNKLWVVAEVVLFVLVGASINLEAANSYLVGALLLLVISLSFRALGVFVSLFKSNLNKREKLFSVFSFMPKATVQAAIGGVPLAYGLACGNLVLTMAVVSIMVTAPLGAFLIDLFYKRLLTNDSNSCNKL